MTLSRALRIIVAVALTAYVLFKSHPAEVARVAAGARPSWLLLAVGLVVVDRAVNAYRWVVLLRAGAMEERLWVDKAGRGVVRSEQTTSMGRVVSEL